MCNKQDSFKSFEALFASETMYYSHQYIHAQISFINYLIYILRINYPRVYFYTLETRLEILGESQWIRSTAERTWYLINQPQINKR